jgi:hypothetical protein
VNWFRPREGGYPRNTQPSHTTAGRHETTQNSFFTIAESSSKDFKQKIAKRTKAQVDRPQKPPFPSLPSVKLVPSEGGRLPTKHPAFAYYGGQARDDAKQRIRD